ncbi:hypothetical protein [Abyssisolibacter fermentans]|uniref:hypothetical protein n=1 Tax=Abyssisolibacter fermentans TaxID=1766203 RepID=UPI00082D03C3|nr:hypothetical protein [Abyssisolibacter fermentans]
MFRKMFIGMCFIILLIAGGSVAYADVTTTPSMPEQSKIGKAVKTENDKLIENIEITSPEDNLITSEKCILVSGKAKEGLKVLIEAYRLEGKDMKTDIEDFLHLKVMDDLNNEQDELIEEKTPLKQNIVGEAVENESTQDKDDYEERDLNFNDDDIQIDKNNDNDKNEDSNDEEETKIIIFDADNNELNLDNLENKDEVLQNLETAKKILAKEIDVKELGIFTEEINVETGNIRILIFIRDKEGNVKKAFIKNIIVADQEKAKEYLENIKTTSILDLEEPQQNYNSDDVEEGKSNVDEIDYENNPDVEK